LRHAVPQFGSAYDPAGRGACAQQRLGRTGSDIANVDTGLKQGGHHRQSM